MRGKEDIEKMIVFLLRNLWARPEECIKEITKTIENKLLNLIIIFLSSFIFLAISL